ncbi:membrane protein [Fervidicella metallireducens AeB]|uniref:Membrane protein n=1 Tax=Fervidicella metallireducens AeB TaxID=1403537 RepID=A0A017RX52_9CLOT|nr:hypothetical protein [Fervidicella metallireducens]EYE88495.1 membrane protein [Fervidicella metallireducens AeB]
MWTFLKVALLDAGIVIVTFILFSAIIPGYKRHAIWEKYISSFAKFVIYIFIATVAINILTAVIVYALEYERYLNIIAPSVQSILIGFVASCVPRRGVGDKKEEKK